MIGSGPITAITSAGQQAISSTLSYGDWARSEHDEEDDGQAVDPLSQVKDLVVMRLDNSFRNLWECALGVVLIYVATLLPFRLTFLDEAFRMESHGGQTTVVSSPVVIKWWANIETYGLDPFFMMDLLLNFFYSYKDEETGREVVKFRKIAARYLKSMFIIDFIACIPQRGWEIIFEFVIGAGNDNSQAGSSSRLLRMQKVSKIARLVRLTRLMKLGGFLKKSALFQRMNQVRAVRMMNFLAGLTTLTHLFACLWYYVAAWHMDREYTWVAQRELYDGSVLIEEENPIIRWTHAMYFVLTVFTTVGYGDMSAFTLGELIFVMILQMVGIFVNSTLMSLAINIAASSDDKAKQLDAQKKVVKGYCDHTMLKQKRGNELKESISTKMKGDMYDRNIMRQMLTSNVFPRDAMTQLPKEMFNGELQSNRFVTVCKAVYTLPRTIPPRFTLLLALACHQRYFEPQEIIYNANDHAWNIFLVFEGIFAAVASANSRGPNAATPLAAISPALEAFLALRKEKERVVVGPALSTQFAKDNIFSPYQLYGKGNFFGEIEVLLTRGGPRSTCVRCEGCYPGSEAIGGSLLVIHKDSVQHFIEEFPPAGDAWRLAAMRREVRMSELADRMSNQLFTHTDLAARLIQDFVRERREYRKERANHLTVVPEGQESAPVSRRNYALKTAEKQHLISRSALRKSSEHVPFYARNLQQDIVTLRGDLTCLQETLRTEVSSLQTGFLELSQALKAAIPKPSPSTRSQL